MTPSDHFLASSPATESPTQNQPVEEALGRLLSSQTALAELGAKSQGFIHAAKAPNTLRAYRSDWQDFTAWCSLHQLPPLPATPETVALYITSLSATHSAGTITRRLTSIAKTHEVAGHSSPATMRHAHVSETLKGIRRTLGVEPKGKTPLLTADIQKILGRLPDNLRGTRDAALFLVGFAGAFRRSELAALTFEDLAFGSEGLVISLGRSKTDPEGKGRKVAIPPGSHRNTCPLRALQKWLEAAQISSGPLFRPVSSHGKVEDKKLHKDSIAGIIKAAVHAAGYAAEEFAGHSLRAGFATQAASNGASELLIMRQTGHRSLTTVRRYIREGTLFRDNAAGKLGL